MAQILCHILFITTCVCVCVLYLMHTLTRSYLIVSENVRMLFMRTHLSVFIELVGLICVRTPSGGKEDVTHKARS